MSHHRNEVTALSDTQRALGFSPSPLLLPWSLTFLSKKWAHFPPHNVLSSSNRHKGDEASIARSHPSSPTPLLFSRQS